MDWRQASADRLGRRQKGTCPHPGAQSHDHVVVFPLSCRIHTERSPELTAYVISEVEVLDEALGQRYRELAAASIAHYGGRYIVRGAQPEVPEGEWPLAQRMVVVQFATMERLRQWYTSPEYAPALAIRRTALARRLLFVEGVEDPEPRPGNSGGSGASGLREL